MNFGFLCGRTEVAIMNVCAMVLGLFPAVAAVIAFATSDPVCLIPSTIIHFIGYKGALGVFGIFTIVVFVTLVVLLIGYVHYLNTCKWLAISLGFAACLFQYVWFVITSVLFFDEAVPYCDKTSGIFAIGMFVFASQLFLAVLGICGICFVAVQRLS
jgi:hypothetical protein